MNILIIGYVNISMLCYRQTRRRTSRERQSRHMKESWTNKGFLMVFMQRCASSCNLILNCNSSWHRLTAASTVSWTYVARVFLRDTYNKDFASEVIEHELVNWESADETIRSDFLLVRQRKQHIKILSRVELLRGFFYFLFTTQHIQASEPPL